MLRDQKTGFWRLHLDSAHWLLVGLAAVAIIGAFVVRDYGQGLDEAINSAYGWRFLHTYETGSLLSNPQIDYYNGPFFMMLWVLGGQVFHWAIPSWLVVDGRHFTTFMTFLVGLWFFFRLSRRFVSPRIGLLTTALFASQPLIFGHAFINQKDIPLMVFFVVSVTFGWDAVDHWKVAHHVDTKGSGLADDWQRLSRAAKFGVVVAIVFGLGLALDLWVFGVLPRAIESIIRDAYGNASLPWVNRLFAHFATDAYKTPVDTYIEKARLAAIWLKLAITTVLTAAALWGATKTFPKTVEPRLRRWGSVVLAGALVGVTTAIRLVGPLAGVIVAFLILVILGRKGISVLIVYFFAAVATMYLCWPILWGDPINALLRHSGQTSVLPSFDVLYAGHVYNSTSLPWHYLPWLLSIQLSLPAVACILLGTVFSARAFFRSHERVVDLSVIAIWIGVPALAVMTDFLQAYNNFRHVLFVVPALFVLAGIGIQAVSRVHLPFALKTAVAVALLVPGLVGIVRLHPYEYIYYNVLVGGVEGAYGRYEMDYWCVSYREAMDYVDRVATKGADVAVAGALPSAESFARSDLNVSLDREARSKPELAIVCIQTKRDPGIYSNYKTVYTAHRGRAIFSVVLAP